MNMMAPLFVHAFQIMLVDRQCVAQNVLVQVNVHRNWLVLINVVKILVLVYVVHMQHALYIIIKQFAVVQNNIPVIHLQPAFQFQVIIKLFHWIQQHKLLLHSKFLSHFLVGLQFSKKKKKMILFVY